jgi:hypothetical protein
MIFVFLSVSRYLRFKKNMENQHKSIDLTNNLTGIAKKKPTKTTHVPTACVSLSIPSFWGKTKYLRVISRSIVRKHI